MVQWIYVVDLDSNTLSVGLPYDTRRVFHLRNIPRSLFDSQLSPSGEILQMGQYRVLIDAVPFAHLAGISVPVEPEAALVELYQSYSSRTEILPSPPNLATLPVRKYFRLCLAAIFSHNHLTALKTIRNGKTTGGSTMDSSAQKCFRQMLYGMVNIMSSGVEVQFKIDRGYRPTEEWSFYRPNDQDGPLMWPTPPAEYWIGDILIIPAMEMTTCENLQAAIGKAIHLINTRTTEPGRTGDNDPPQSIRALIVSLSAVVVVDICGSKLIQTPIMPLIARYHDVTPGLCALLEILYTPVPRPLANSICPLPVELWRRVYSLAEHDIKFKLGATSRLFRGIAYDYGLRIGEWSLQRPRPSEEGLACVAAADRRVQTIGRTVRDLPARSAVVYVSTFHTHPIYRIVLMRPTGEALELQMPLVGVNVSRNWAGGRGESKWCDGQSRFGV